MGKSPMATAGYTPRIQREGEGASAGWDRDGTRASSAGSGSPARAAAARGGEGVILLKGTSRAGICSAYNEPEWLDGYVWEPWT